MRFLPLLFFAVGLAALSPLTAQEFELTPEQRARLESLPPNLRQQAEAELRKAQAAQRGRAARPETPEVVRPLRPEEGGGQDGNGDGDEGEREARAVEDTFEAAEREARPTARVARERLEQFGYDLFAGEPTTFAPATEIPVPSDYVIGPGDQIRLQFYGKDPAAYDLYVTREGVLQAPELGPVAVAGLRFSELKAEIAERVARQTIGREVFVSLGELRSIRVFILGDARHPGSYTVSSLSTLTNALLVSGGIKPIGSLRRVQLKRAGSVEATLDLYDLLLHGDTSDDVRLMPGDVIFVPPVGKLVGVAGEIRRPAIYELKEETTIGELLAMAGGATANAYLPLSQIERITANGLKEIVDIDLSETQNMDTPLRDGDTLRVFGILERADNVVALEGQVSRPGDYEWRPGMRVRDLLGDYQDVVPDADLRYALVVSRHPANGRISTRSFSLERLFGNPSSKDNLPLRAKDRIIVFDARTEEREGLEEVVRRLRSQATSEAPEKVVQINGHVRHPGSYPLDEGMTADDLVRAAGGFSQEAYTLEAELLRFSDNGKTRRETRIVPVRLASASLANDVELEPFDQILVKRIPNWNENEQIVLEGEVRFPGAYTIKRGETLSDALERAGGLTELAHPRAAVFTRASLRRREAEQMRTMQERLREDIQAARLQESEFNAESIETAERLLEDIENTEAVGRLVIDLQGLLAEKGDDKLVRIRGGDRLVVPQQPQSVTIVGSVNFPTSHLHRDGLTRNDYLDLSGGLLRRADKKSIYVIRADGQVAVPERRSNFFPGRPDVAILPGDTIVVPVDADRLKPLEFWGDVSQIIFQFALAAAAVASF